MAQLWSLSQKTNLDDSYQSHAPPADPACQHGSGHPLPETATFGKPVDDHAKDNGGHRQQNQIVFRELEDVCVAEPGAQEVQSEKGNQSPDRERKAEAVRYSFSHPW